MTIRRGVCQFDINPENEMDIILYITKPVFDEVISGNTSIEAALANGDASLTGDLSDLEQFLDYFETPGAEPISLTLH